MNFFFDRARRRPAMSYVKLGSAGLKVSNICLGTMSFGSQEWQRWTINERTSRNIVKAALELGINFFDTADRYGNGSSEEFLGRALEGRRDQVIIATKFGMEMGKGQGGASSKYVRKAIEASLRRLRTDRVDLYQLHQPDPKTPIADTLGAP